jgi:hypothetical protein
VKLEPRRLRAIRAMLDESLDWRLSDEEWGAVRTVVDRLADAVARDDPADVEQAREALQRCDPRRRIVKARPESTRMPEELRERQNTVVHEIDVRLPDRPDGRAAAGR